MAPWVGTEIFFGAAVPRVQIIGKALGKRGKRVSRPRKGTRKPCPGLVRTANDPRGVKK
jgi:hypothetical protein